MPFQPVGIGFRVFLAQMLLRADLMRVLLANSGITGSALFVFHLPIAKQIGGASAGAVTHTMSPAANDTETAAGKLNRLAHHPAAFIPSHAIPITKRATPKGTA
jgi:hypothetical protein